MSVLLIFWTKTRIWYLKDENPWCGEETENVHPHVRSYLYHLEEIMRGSHGWVMAHMDESWHTWMSHGTHGWVMAHMDESWHTWMSHGTHGWVMAHMDESHMSHGTRGWVIAHMKSFYCIHLLYCSICMRHIWLTPGTSRMTAVEWIVICVVIPVTLCANVSCERLHANMSHMNDCKQFRLHI